MSTQLQDQNQFQEMISKINSSDRLQQLYEKFKDQKKYRDIITKKLVETVQKITVLAELAQKYPGTNLNGQALLKAFKSAKTTKDLCQVYKATVNGSPIEGQIANRILELIPNRYEDYHLLALHLPKYYRLRQTLINKMIDLAESKNNFLDLYDLTHDETFGRKFFDLADEFKDYIRMGNRISIDTELGKQIFQKIVDSDYDIWHICKSLRDGEAPRGKVLRIILDRSETHVELIIFFNNCSVYYQKMRDESLQKILKLINTPKDCWELIHKIIIKENKSAHNQIFQRILELDPSFDDLMKIIESDMTYPKIKTQAINKLNQL